MGDQNVERVRGVYEAFGRGDRPAVLGAMAEDIEWHEAEGLPYGGVYRGPQQVAENVFGPITTDLEGFVVTPEKLIASERRCFTVSALGSLVAESHFAGLTAEPEQLPAA